LHLGDTYPHRPIDRGFQEAVHIHGWGFSSAPEFANTLMNGRYFHNEVEERFTGYCTDFWFERAMAWMKQQHDASHPFFCYLPLNAPHFPLVVDRKYSAPYENRGLDAPPRYRNEGQGVAGFFGMIANIDENIQRLETFLEKNGLKENTILIFMTDNGGTAGIKVWNAGLREGKTTFYDGGHRVPFWIRWPAGRLGSPRDINVPAQAQDALPTLLELGGVKAPATARFDGLSLAGLIRENRPLPDRKFVVQYSQAKLKKWDSAVVWNQWRLVHGTELYDVNADRAQAHDVAATHPDVVEQLRAHYEKWWSELEPVRDQFVTLSLGAEAQPTVTLTSADWQDVYADNSRHVRNALGGPRGGHWNVKVERAGEYEIRVYRWPPDQNTALIAPNGSPSKALPIASAKLTIADRELSAKAEPEARSIAFRVQLPAGPTQLHAWFQAEGGKDLSGCFYTVVSWLR
jgi:arylsulfatase A-like enzyme